MKRRGERFAHLEEAAVGVAGNVLVRLAHARVRVVKVHVALQRRRAPVLVARPAQLNGLGIGERR